MRNQETLHTYVVARVWCKQRRTRVKPPGHLAFGLYCGKRMGITGRHLGWVLLGALLPDIIDKPLMYLDVTPYGRSIGHAPVVWVLMWLVWLLWVRVRMRSGFHIGAIGVLVGVTSHLLADLSNDVINGWLFTGFVFEGWVGWPWVIPEAWYVRVNAWRSDLKGVWTPLEVGVVCWGMWMMCKTVWLALTRRAIT